MPRVEIDCLRTDDGTECGHTSIGEDDDHADQNHYYHLLADHDLDSKTEAVVRDRLSRLEDKSGVADE